MNKVQWSCLVAIVLTWGVYYINFGRTGTLSSSTEVWGQFGDYVGGVVNPILTFVTIYLLIKSIGLQRESNDCLVDEIKRQEKLEDYKKFESRFFRLVESQENSFERFKINIGNDTNGVPQILSGNAAVSFIEDSLSILIKARKDIGTVKEWLNNLDDDGVYFSLTRRFYLILKLVNDNTMSKNSREDMYEILVNLTDIKIISMITILSLYYDWDNIKYIKATNILDREGLREYASLYRLM